MISINKTGYKRNYNGELIELNQCENLSIEPKNSTKIIELNDECLVHILKKLHLEDLSNVVHVNKQFNQSAYNYLKKKCTNVNVTVYCANGIQWLWIDGIMGKFMFNNATELQTFFINAGDSISRLSILCATNTATITYQMVEQSILKYCSQSLVNIEFRLNHLPALSDVSIVFPNVVNLMLDGCELSEQFCQQFEDIFPSMCQLVLNECKTWDPKCIEKNFPCLTDMIINGKRKNRNVFKKSNIEEFFRQNPQIHRLIINFNSTNDREASNNHPDFRLDLNFFRLMSDTLPKLEYLEIYGERRFSSNEYGGGDDVTFLQLKKLSIHYIYGLDPSEIAPFTFRRLRELNLGHMNILTEDWVQFIIRNEGLEKLMVNTTNMMTQDEHMEEHTQIGRDKLLTIIKWLPKLKEFHLSAKAVEPCDVLAILSKRKSLMKVYLCDYTEIDSIVETFDKLTAKKKWMVSYDYENLILKRIIS